MKKKKTCKDCDLVQWKHNGGILRPSTTNQSFKSYNKNGTPNMYAICPECGAMVKPHYKCFK